MNCEELKISYKQADELAVTFVDDINLYCDIHRARFDEFIKMLDEHKKGGDENENIAN